MCLTELGVKVALGHLGHVVLMQELALVPFLAQSSQPVFAHNCLLTTDVSEWTHAPCQGRVKRYIGSGRNEPSVSWRAVTLYFEPTSRGISGEGNVDLGGKRANTALYGYVSVCRGQKAGEGVRSPGNRVTEGCESHVGAGNCTWVFWKSSQ